MRTTLGVLLLGVMVASSTWGQSLDDARQQLQKGAYKAAITTADRALQARSAPSEADQYELLMVKGESLLQLRKLRPAQVAFTQAAAIAPDLKRAAAAEVNAIVLAGSRGNVYTPQSGDAKPINIVDRKTRDQAVQAILVDTRQAATDAYEHALQSTDLPNIEQAVQTVFDYACLQHAAGVDTKETAEMLMRIVAHAQKMIGIQLDRIQSTAGMLERSSNSYDESSDGPRGLGPREREDLDRAAEELRHVQDAIARYRSTAIRFQRNPEAWDALLAKTTMTQTQIVALQRYSR